MMDIAGPVNTIYADSVVGHDRLVSGGATSALPIMHLRSAVKVENSLRGVGLSVGFDPWQQIGE
jgi:hypothetical protein